VEKSLFYPLKVEGLTSLKLRYDYRTDKEYLTATKEWDDDIRWSDYNRAFYAESLLTQNDKRLNNHETRAMYEKYGLKDYLNEFFALLRSGKFFGLDCYYYKKKDMRFTANLHSIVLGLNNKDQAIYTGGIRRHDKDEPEIDVIIDGLNLGRAQSHKNVACQIPYGGGKITVQADPVDLNDKEELGFLSFALDRVRFFTGPDMRYPIEMADAMNEFTVSITAGPSNPIGSSGPPTAWGVYVAMKEAIKFHFGKNSMKEMTIAVMGLGSVGYAQAEYLLQDGAKLIVCDVDSDAPKRLKKQFPDASIQVVDVENMLGVEADILCPCAVGGFLTEDVIASVKFKMIFGAANNQLHATNRDEEIRLANLLMKRGILYQECWVQNIGGVMSGEEMYSKGEKANKKELYERIERVCGESTRNNLQEAKGRGISPTENAYRSVEDKIYR
jgi:glutamate dehydrogenase/leucine dehydrogenase